MRYLGLLLGISVTLVFTGCGEKDPISSTPEAAAGKLTISKTKAGGYRGRQWQPPVGPLDETKLNAVKVFSAPYVDGSGADLAWSPAPELVVSLGDGMEEMDCSTCHSLNSSVQVRLKAVHTEDKLYILASWPDPTASFTRSGSWSFNQESGVWSKSTGQSEDRIGFFFPIGEIAGDDFNTGGCMTKCHVSDKHAEFPGNEDESYLIGGTGDMWHMKAARMLPVNSATSSGTVDPVTHEITSGVVEMSGWMDDKYVADYSVDNSPDGGRYGDAGSGAYSHNRIGDKSKPKYMEMAPVDFMDAMVLTEAEIDGGEVVGDATTGVSDTDAALYWPQYAALDAVVPERILREPSGSRGDIRQAAQWRDGMWTTEIVRSLRTGNADDVQFVPGGEYLFGVATMDNTGGEKHKPSGKQFLKIIQ